MKNYVKLLTLTNRFDNIIDMFSIFFLFQNRACSVKSSSLPIEAIHNKIKGKI